MYCIGGKTRCKNNQTPSSLAAVLVLLLLLLSSDKGNEAHSGKQYDAHTARTTGEAFLTGRGGAGVLIGRMSCVVEVV